MLKVNLEHELIRTRKVEIATQELLKVQEFDRLGDIVTDDEVLNRVGVNTAAKQGRVIKNQHHQMKSQTAIFPQERVFHISQIEALCNKYYLRFLPSRLFCGSVDDKLASKIMQAEIAYGIVMDGGTVTTNSREAENAKEEGKMVNKIGHWILSTQYEIGCNTYIVAPASSFKLEERPKDPLFFYQINSEYFFLVHKWGNDLNFTRRFLTLLSKSNFCWLAAIVLLALILIPLLWANSGNKGATTALTAVLAGVSMALTIFRYVFGDDSALKSKNDFQSRTL